MEKMHTVLYAKYFKIQNLKNNHEPIILLSSTFTGNVNLYQMYTYLLPGKISNNNNFSQGLSCDSLFKCLIFKRRRKTIYKRIFILERNVNFYS